MQLDLTRESLNDRTVRVIREKMAGQRLSGVRLGKLIGKRQGWVSWRLTGKTRLSLDDIDQFALALDVNTEELTAPGYVRAIATRRAS